MTTNNTLVLGANGFIGSNIVDKLSKQGRSVVAFDRYSKNPQFNINSNVKIIKGDIFSSSDLVSALEGVDYVFHCFSATTPYTSEIDPYSDITKNILNSVSIFDLCAKNNIKKVVYISSGGTIYGKTAEIGIANEDSVCLPISPYGISKLSIERYLAYFEKKYKLQSLVFRLTNPYGPRQIVKHNQGVVPVFLEKIVNQEKIIVYGDGSSSRDYIYINDAVDLICDIFDKNTQYNLYNLGSGIQTSLLEIIKILADKTGNKPIIEYKDKPSTFVDSVRIDTGRIKDEFHFVNKTTFEAGISNLLNN